MIGLSHIALNVTLCSAMTRRGPDTPIDVRVRLINRIDKPAYDHTFRITRGYADQRMIDFNAPFGVYGLVMSSKQFGCNGTDWLMILPDHDRTINETLVDGRPTVTHPTLMVGSLPASFSYANPTVALFDKSQACNTPVGDPLPLKTVVENDQNAFYVWMYPDASLAPHAPVVVTVQLTAADGENHYVRLKVPFPTPWRGFPETWEFNISENTIDGLSQEKTGTLLCPRIYETSAG